MKVAIVGRRNVGKSTFINTLAQAERMIVSEVPGTTRDSVDVRFELDGKPFIAIDTPGLRRTKSITTDIDFYSTHRAQRSIRRADVVLLFFDPTQRISKVDKQLCDYIAEQVQALHLRRQQVGPAWPAACRPTSGSRYLHDTFRTMRHVPIAFITGQTGKNVKALLNHAQMLFKQARERVTTGAAEQGACAQALDAQSAAACTRTAGRRSTTPRRSASSRRRSCCSATIREAFDEPYRRYLLGVLPRAAAVRRSADQALPAQACQPATEGPKSIPTPTDPRRSSPRPPAAAKRLASDLSRRSSSRPRTFA